jgi:hypothetical protein
MSTTSMPVSGSEKTWLDRLMSLAAEVHPGEALSALLLAVNVFAWVLLAPGIAREHRKLTAHAMPLAAKASTS